ncbi:MAG: AAA family ATPase [Lachnospiraceae bacterium]|nr:AAA family ATPase [Lachnospiraceae bacterium]
MGRKKKRIDFHLKMPDVRTVYLGTGAKQRAEYLQLPKDFGRRIFEEDVASGADIYEGFTDILNHKETQYNIITAPSKEDGLRAVAYMAGIMAESEGFNEEDISYEDFDQDEHFKRETELVEDEITQVPGDSDEDDEDDYKYIESFDRIPLIRMRELTELEENRNFNYGFGNINLEFQNNAKKITPWWLSCTEQAVCVIIDHQSNDGFWISFSETISEFEISQLRRFKDNRAVFLLIVDNTVREDDFSVNTAMLEYTANCFHVEQKQSVLSEYYKKLLLAVAAGYGYTFSKTLDLTLLADKLSKIDKQKPCSKFIKIMEYLKHIGASQTLRAKDFENLGLKKLIDMIGAEDGNLSIDTELVGMDKTKKQVKNIMNMLRFIKLRTNRNMKNSRYHNVHLFIGAPGTAKTTMAKMMAKAMQKEGLISGNRFISVTGAQLKGAYVGQTAPKVHELFNNYDAIFIDEAYSLVSGSEGEGGIDSYAQEALAQLAVELEEHAMDKLVIFAGYGGKKTSKKDNLMFKFLKSNPGISSRINSTVYFDSYTPEDMIRIVRHLAEEASLRFPTEGEEELKEYFASRQNDNDFGNGREARSFLEHCECYVAERVSAKDPEKLTDKELNTILAEDVRGAIKDLKQEKTDQIGQNNVQYGFLNWMRKE